MLFRNGITIFIEVKQPGKKLRTLQEYRKEEICKEGFIHITAIDDNIPELNKDYGQPIEPF